MHIDTIRRDVDDRNVLIVTGQTCTGFGSRASDIGCRREVKILDAAAFEAMREAEEPTSYQDMGCNYGAPRDGLIMIKQCGVRFLSDSRGSDDTFLFAHADDCPSSGLGIETQRELRITNEREYP